VYFNVNFNVFFKLIKVHLLVSELYMYLVYFVTQILEGFPTDRTLASTIGMRLITMWSVAGHFIEVRRIDLGNTLYQLLRKFWCEITQISTVNIVCQTRSV